MGVFAEYARVEGSGRRFGADRAKKIAGVGRGDSAFLAPCAEIGYGVALTVFYDGWCSLCAGTARSIERLDRGRGRVRTVDFRADFSGAAAVGITAEALEGAMHALHPDGRVTAGPEAVRDAVRAAGLGPLAAVLGWPVVGAVFARAYDVVARNRLKWFGKAASGGCAGGVCRLDGRPPGE